MCRTNALKVTVAALLLLTMGLGACGQQAEPTEEPTEVAQVVKDTPVPPTETSVPPTDTTIPTETSVPSDTPVPTETPDLVATQVEVERAAAATLTAEAPTETPAPTDTPEPTATATEIASPTPAASNTPKPTPKPKMGKILFTSNRVSWDDIFVMNEDGTNVQQLTKRGVCYNAHFSPDGKRIVFDHAADIWIMNADGSGQVNLTESDELEAFPVFSSNGQRVAFLFGSPAGFEIGTMKVDGTDRKVITSGSFDWMPAWQPGGNKIAFSSARTGLFNIWTVNADGSDLKQVTQFGDFGALSPVWSPDGKQIGMVRYAGNSWEVWAVNADGSNPHLVTQIVGGDDGFIPDMGGWKRGKFVFGGYHGNWDVAVVADGGGQTSFLSDHPKDDKPSDWWVP
jgi:Tol biopolymer transport system component